MEGEKGRKESAKKSCGNPIPNPNFEFCALSESGGVPGSARLDSLFDCDRKIVLSHSSLELLPNRS